jgi:hypothetical protein
MVTFSYRNCKDQGKVKPLALNAMEFIRRFMQHLFPSGFQKIYYYGFLMGIGAKSRSYSPVVGKQQ